MSFYGLVTTGLLALALTACAAPPPTGLQTARPAAADIDWEHAQKVTVGLSDFDFSPDHLVFKAGTPIRLILEDNGSGQHDFSAPQFFAAAAYRAGSAPPERGRVVLKEKQTVELDIVPMTPGKYDLECTEFLHAMFGMTGAIDVTG